MTEATIEELRALEAAEMNGKSIEAMAEDGDIERDDETVYIEGSSGQLSLTVGGRKPDGSELKLGSAAVKVTGQYPKGETIEFRVLARVDRIQFMDIHDTYGTVTATKRVHFATPVSVERVVSDDEVS